MRSICLLALLVAGIESTPTEVYTYVSVNLPSGTIESYVRISPPSQVCPCSWPDTRSPTMLVASPVDGCTTYASSEYKGAIVLVDRGGCDFVAKAENLQRAGAVAVLVRDNVTGTPVDMGLGASAFKVKVPLASVNQETGTMLATYSKSSAAGTVFTIHSDQCPFALGTFSSQMVVWSIGVATCILASYLAAAGERQAVNGLTYDYQTIGRDSVQPEEEEEVNQDITLTMAVGYFFFASLMLVVLFFFIDKLIIGVILFYVIGATGALHHVFCILGSTKLCGALNKRDYEVPCFGKATPMMILAFPCALAISVGWFFCRHDSWAWLLQDLMSHSLCVQILTLIRVPNLRITGGLLTMMFFYDIFWVFLSGYFFKKSVMVAVATGGGGESLPMLFAIPHDCGYSLLGLGDIVIPGLLLSLMIRYDYAFGRAPFSTNSYFLYSCVGYAVGLAMADAAVLLTGLGQPALLYLVPCTLGLNATLAYTRGELSTVWLIKPEDIGQAVAAHHDDYYGEPTTAATGVQPRRGQGGERGGLTARA